MSKIMEATSVLPLIMELFMGISGRMGMRKDGKKRRLLIWWGLFVFFLAMLGTRLGAQEGVGSIGITIDRDPQDQQGILIYTVSYKSPADKAGVRRGDKLLKVDALEVWGMILEDVAAKIRGAIGTTLMLTVPSPGGAPRDIPLARVSLPKGPIVSVPPPQVLTQNTGLNDQEKTQIKQKILALTTEPQRLRMLELLTQLKDNKITKQQFFTLLNTEFP